MGSVSSIGRQAAASEAPRHVTPDMGGSEPPKPLELVMPDIVLPPPSLSQIAAAVESAYHGTESIEEAEDAVAKHHREKIEAALVDAGQEPSALRKGHEARLAAIDMEITRFQADHAITPHGEEFHDTILAKRDIVDYAELGAYMLVAGALCTWSITTMQAYLSNSAIFSNWQAFLASLGPLVISFALKGPLSSVELERHKKLIQHGYLACTAVAAGIWVLTFGHEAGAQSVAAFSDVNNTGTGTDNTARMMLRGGAQLVIEVLGGAVLFHKIFEVWRRRGTGQSVKRYRVHDKWQHLQDALDGLLARKQAHEHALEKINKWFESHKHISDSYVSTAVGQFRSSMNLLKMKGAAA